jgi:AraC-like DNA-binding protein
MTNPEHRQSMKNDLLFVCQVLGLKLDDVLKRADVPTAAIADRSAGSIRPQTYFALWNACRILYGGPDFALRLGQAMAQVPFTTPIFAYYCSRNVRQGLERLAVFKPLIGPLRYRVEDRTDAVVICMEATDPLAALPPSMALFEVAFLSTLIRNTTATEFRPTRVVSPDIDARIEDFVGCPIERGAIMALHISREDAARPLVTRNPDMWQIFEPHLKVALAEELLGSAIVEQVRNTLLEALPAGNSTIVEVASRMGISQRSLQRKLADASTSYTKLLEDTRLEIASRYLRATSLSLQEIAYLLGYNETSSFFRAFRKMTGKTPLGFRNGPDQAEGTSPVS